MSDGIPRDIPRDVLAEIAWTALKEADREARGEDEGPPSVPPWANPSLDARCAAVQRRLDQIAGRDRAAEAAEERERTLIRYLQARDGMTGAVWERPRSLREREDIAFRELHRSLRNSYF